MTLLKTKYSTANKIIFKIFLSISSALSLKFNNFKLFFKNIDITSYGTYLTLFIRIFFEFEKRRTVTKFPTIIKCADFPRGKRKLMFENNSELLVRTRSRILFFFYYGVLLVSLLRKYLAKSF